MANIDDIFKDAEGGALTLEQFKEKAKTANAKFVDLSEGGYVSQNKYDTDTKAKDDQIFTLNETLEQRDKDLVDVKEKLEAAGVDAEKLSTLSTELSTLQTKYDDDTKAYQEQLSKQAREFAIKEYAASKNFTSTAAKRDYISCMKESDLIKLGKDGKLKGLTDFDAEYTKENEDAFVKEVNTDPQPPIVSPTQPTQFPEFVQQTPGEPFKDDSKGGFGFSFIPESNSTQ